MEIIFMDSPIIFFQEYKEKTYFISVISISDNKISLNDRHYWTVTRHGLILACSEDGLMDYCGKRSGETEKTADNWDMLFIPTTCSSVTLRAVFFVVKAS